MKARVVVVRYEARGEARDARNARPDGGAVGLGTWRRLHLLTRWASALAGCRRTRGLMLDCGARTARGGPIAVIAEGDSIVFDPMREIADRFSDAELKKGGCNGRRRRHIQDGSFCQIAALVSSASLGRLLWRIFNYP